MKDMNYEIGSNYARNGDYKDAARYLRKSIDDGNFDAANDLGVIYERNDMYKQAMGLYKIAGCAGHATATHNVANLYEKGLGVKQDLIKARKYYEYSAKLGYALAYKKLAKLYLYGIGVEKDQTKSIFYLEQGMKIEKKGGYKDNDCINALAYNYSEGLGVKQSDKKAYKLWKICAKHGDINAIYNIAICYLYGEVVKKNVNKALTILADLACKKHYGYAIKMMAEIYAKEDFGMKDLNESGYWLIEGARYGEIHCLLKIAEICLSGDRNDYGWKRDFTEQAVLDFLKTTDGSEQEYEDELNEYNKLKEKYTDNIDWAYLETLPESIEDNRQPNELC